MNEPIGLVFATNIESEPFVKGLCLEQIENKPFGIYSGDRYYLVNAGIGKANAAMAASYLIYKYNTKIIFNIGAAGSTTTGKKLGDIFHIEKAVEYDRPKIFSKGIRILEPDMLEGFSTATLATQDKPVISPQDRLDISIHADLVDMEGASVIQACRLFGARCFLFKIVTDTPLHEEADIIKNVKNTAVKMFEFFKAAVLKNI
ncbi:MAG: hypothetical protein V1874_09770 [Spirochaetota bacterium]